MTDALSQPSVPTEVIYAADHSGDTGLGQVTDVDIDFYHENGFLVVPGLVTSEEVAMLKEDAARVCRGRDYPHESLPPGDLAETDVEVLGRYLCIHQPHKISPVVLEV